MSKSPRSETVNTYPAVSRVSAVSLQAGQKLCLSILPLRRLYGILRRRTCPQLQSVDAASGLEFLLQQRVYHPVPCGLHFGDEGLRDDDEPEVCLSGDVSLHCFVVCMHTRIIVDVKPCRLQSLSNLFRCQRDFTAIKEKYPESSSTFIRIASSIGAADIVDRVLAARESLHRSIE